MVANTTLQTQFNVNPYWDDYNVSKHFYRILYNPSLAVQARELTQQQTIQTEQLRRFADHIFKEGSLVSGGQFNLDLQYHYVKLNDVNSLSQNISVANFVNTEVTGFTSGVKGIVIGTATGSDAAANTKTLFIRYSSAGFDGTTKFFLPGETLVANSGFQAVVTSGNTSVGTGSNFSINAGVIYGKTLFLDFDDQSIVLNRYSNEPSCRVGFKLTESIVTHNDDTTLNSLAQGSTNYAAPGADRFRITATLDTRPLGTANTTDANFVELFTIKDGVVQTSAETTQYSLIRDELARRTYDESGDYYVNGLDVRIREHLDDGTNQGYLTLENGGNTSLLAIGVEPGKAYVKGYDIRTLVPTYISTRKGTDTLTVSNQNVSTNYGNYVMVNELVGSWDVNAGTILKLYDTAQQRITNRTYSAGSQTGTLLGTARFKALEYDDGVMGSADASYRLYLYDISMSNAAFSQVKSIYYDNSTTSDIGADVVLSSSNTAVLIDTNFNVSLFNLPASAVKSIRDESNNVQTSFSFLKSFPVTIATAGTFSLSTGNANEVYYESVGTLNTEQKHNFIVTLNAAANVSMTGTATTNSGNTTVVGSSTHFDYLNVGDKIEIDTLSGTYTVTNVVNATNMTVTPAPVASVSTQSFSKVYKPGDIVNFAGIGADAGASKSIVVNTTTNASFDLKETLSNTVSATVTTRFTRTSAQEAKKNLRRNRYVIIDCSANTTGPFNLGIPDVFKINFIRKGSSFTTDADGTDVTSSFTLDNGQRDNFYDHARLIKVGGSLSASDKLLVKLDYFAHDYSQGVGYFSIDSYPIDDVHAANNTAISTKEIPVYKSATNGAVYNLRNAIDVRPSKTIIANDSTTISGASTNPSPSTAFEAPSGGLHTTVPNQNFTLDYSYYLGRKDLVVLNGEGQFRIVEGVPFTVPVTPSTPSDAMSIGVINITPYPSLPPFVASQISRSDLACSVNKTAYIRFTMRDLGVMKQRVDNLEYYESLNLLEQNAINLKIPDENGLDRFKNGIFVDPFTSHKFGDLKNPDYNIAVDKAEGCIRPVFDLDDIKIDYRSGSGVSRINNIVMLNYTEDKIITQPYSTTNRNTASQFWKFKGEMVLSPDQDFWVDTQQNPDVQIDLAGENQIWAELINNNPSWNTVWNDWQTTWTGVPSTSSRTRATGVGEVMVAGLGNTMQTQFTTTTTTTQTSGQTRTGSRTTISFENERSVSDFVIDTSLIPYIRPQTIKIAVTGLKATTQMYAFFDDENMNDYCTQTDSDFTPTKDEGDALVCDDENKLYFLLRLPTEGKRFRVGTKKVRITDSITNEDDALTSAEAYFVAQGLKQETGSLTTATPTVSTTNISESRTVSSSSTSTSISSQITSITETDPISQTFMVTLPPNIPGVFVTSLDLYFQQVDNDYSIKVQLREVDNAGNITSTVLPYSNAVVQGSDINESDDGSVATKFNFEGPVFLENGAQYAFVVLPESNNPNFYLWTAKLGQDDLITGERVTSQPYVGIMFVSSNNSTWSPIQDEDIKFDMYRAKFTTGSYGTVVLKNAPIEKVKVSGITAAFDHYGETIRGETRLTFSGVSGTISNTDLVTGVSSNTTGQINFVNGSTYRLKDVTGNQTFTLNESVTFASANGTSTGATATVASQTIPQGVLEKYDSGNSTIRLKNASGTFVVGEQMIGMISNAAALIEELQPIKYSTADYESSFITLAGTNLTWEAKGTSNTSVVDSSYSAIQINDNNYFQSERIILGNSDETTDLSGEKSLNIRASLFSSIDYVSPIIDLNRTHTVLIHNIVNANNANETNATGGAAINKYISQKVTLADQQDAEDMKIWLSAYRPPGTDIYVYVKLLNGEDSDIFDERNWMLIDQESPTFYSSSTNINDYKEFIYTLPDDILTGENGAVQYTNSRGVDLTGYKYFSIKIVLLSDNSAVVPKVSDLRVIALQK